MSRQGRHGEAYFATLCQDPSSKIEAVLNESANDLHGWDHVIDIVPSRKSSHLPPDLQDYLYQCFAQIKTTERRKPYTTMKLSNALKLAKSPAPAFLFLFHYKKGGKTPDLYGRHIWLMEIEDTLRRAREAGIKTASLNKVIITYKFTDEDLILKPAEWMHEKIESSGGSEYSKNKLEIVKTVGYERGGKTGTFDIDCESVNELVNFEIGLADAVPFRNFKIYDERFGLKSVNPIENFDGGFVSVAPEGRSVVVQLKSPDGYTIKIPAKAYTPRSVSIDDPEFRVRVSAGPLDLITSFDKKSSTFNVKWNRHEKILFSHQIGLLSYLSWASKGPVEYKVTCETGTLFSGKMGSITEEQDWSTDLLTLGRYLSELIDPDKLDNLNCSLDDLVELGVELQILSKICLANSTRYHVRINNDLPSFDAMAGYVFGSVGNIGFGATHVFKVHHVDKKENTREIVFEKPVTSEKFSYLISQEKAEEISSTNFEITIKEFDYTFAILEGGNLNAWASTITRKGSEISISVKTPDER